jgi:hypothetical protein
VIFISVLLLLIVSITPVMAQPIVEFLLEYQKLPTRDSPGIHGASVFFTNGGARGYFVIQQPPDPITPRHNVSLTPQAGRMECIRELPHFWILATAYQRGRGNDVQSGEYVVTITPDSTGEHWKMFFEFQNGHQVLDDHDFNDVRLRVAPPNPC